MARIIDADNTVRTICGYYCGCERDECGSGEPCEAVAFIEDAPTISPDEVRGVGKWIKRKKVRKNLPADSDYLYSCSVCGCGDEHNENVSVPFCWHCGAKMEVSEDA